jgi:vesicle coat complex subunit
MLVDFGLAIPAFLLRSDLEKRLNIVSTALKVKFPTTARHPVNREPSSLFMVAPLKKTLTDEDPYVRKTAAFGVAKLFDMIPEIVENSGRIPDLQSLLHDSNPMVIANSLAALYEINDQKPDAPLPLDSTTLNPVIQAVPESSAWCQIILLDGLSRYPPNEEEDADYLVDKFLEFLKHNNAAVVIGAFRCLFAWVHRSSRDPTEALASMVPPFITLLHGTCAEIIIHRYPRALTREIRVFFCKYNDPTYVKMEKLDIVVRICEAVNAELELDELSEYSKAVDVPFIRKAIRCIGQIAVKIEPAAPRCADVLVALVAAKADYAVEESIIVVTEILRKFPGQFESILQDVCQRLVADSCSLSTVTFASGCKPLRIERDAFLNCLSFSSICISAAVGRLGHSAFCQCRSSRTIDNLRRQSYLKMEGFL